MILNAKSPLLPSCWGFSFALGHGVSPHSCSSATQPEPGGRNQLFPQEVLRLDLEVPLTCCSLIPGFPEGSVVKNSLANVEDTRDNVHSLGLGRSSGVGSGNHYSILAWKIPWTGEPGGLYCMGSQSDMTEYTADSNVNPIQNRFIETLRKMSHQIWEQSMA